MQTASVLVHAPLNWLLKTRSRVPRSCCDCIIYRCSLTSIHCHRSCCCPVLPMPHKVAHLKLPLLYASHLHSLSIPLSPWNDLHCYRWCTACQLFFLSFVLFAFSSLSAFCFLLTAFCFLLSLQRSILLSSCIGARRLVTCCPMVLN